MSSENQPSRPGNARQSTRQSTRSYGTLDTQGSITGFPPDEGQPENSSRLPVSQSPSIVPLSDKQRKPSFSRRASYKRQKSQKMPGFSTDDAVREVEEDLANQQSTNPQPSPRIRPLRRQSSTLRRRLNSRPSPVIQAEPEDENGADEPGLSAPKLAVTEAGPSTRGHDDGGDNGNDHDDDPDDEDDDDNNGADDDDDDDDDETSDAESFTLKDRQQAINETHPFGIRIWKPALYKKSRSVEKTAEGDIHSSPGGQVSSILFLTNLLWLVCFGWWLGLAALLGALACFAVAYSPSAVAYGRVFAGLSWYLVYPFGSFVQLESDEQYAEEDEGEGRSISEYEQWQNGDIEHGGLFFGPHSARSLVGRRRNSVDSASEQESLLGRQQRGHHREVSLNHTKRRLFGRGEWTLGRVVFYAFFYFLIGPLLLLVSLVCWLLVFWIPMARVTSVLFSHLRRHPLALSFHADAASTRPSSDSSSSPSSILLCTYRAAGLKYWKYTVDGTNVFLINLLGVVLFVIFDYYFLRKSLGIESWLTHPGLIFSLALISIIPLAYFIGQAVASISAQSSMGLGAAINAFFSTIVEVYLYCVALTEGKGQLVEGSIIGSIFAGILFLPGLSMCFGAIKRKTQRFNVKSAGVTSTMLMFAVIAAFGPTLFYQIYGSHELNCRSCVNSANKVVSDCRRCYFSQVPAINDKFFLKAVQPYSWFSALFLFLSYVIGLWFTLRTHAALIWATEAEEKKAANIVQDPTASYEPRHFLFPDGQQGGASSSGGNTGTRGSVRDSQLYRRILGQSLKQIGLPETNPDDSLEQPASGSRDNNKSPPYLVPPRAEGDGDGSTPTTSKQKSPGGPSNQSNKDLLVRQVAEVAATAAAVASRDAARPKKPTPSQTQRQQPSIRQSNNNKGPTDPVKAIIEYDDIGLEHAHASGGHDAPNWSKAKSAVVLLVATVLYAIIAEILVNTVDVVLDSVDIDEKFLGITLFALVPNTTEFLNAISFAMNGNIALSMEIGSAYALQVCLLQIPALVLFSAFYGNLIDPSDIVSRTFNLIFPQWDMVSVILCVFLLSYVHGEGKSNYFKGSILVLTYLVVIIGFYLSGYSNMDAMGVDRFDTLALGGAETARQELERSFHTIGRSRSGVAY